MSRIAFGAISVALLVLTLFLFPPLATMGDLGICLPSPNSWPISRFWGWLADALLLFLAAIVMGEANKKFNFIPEATPIMPLGMLVLVACNPISTAALTTSTLLLFCNALSLMIVISTYEEHNASREFFLLGTIPAIGAMVQYSFLMMIPVYVAGGIMMKSFRLREFVAYLFGIMAPYWIALGLGLVSPLAFRLPETLVVFDRSAVDGDIFLTLIAAGIMAVVGFIFSLYNSVRLFSRNSRLRCMHMTLNFMGYAAILAIIFDFSNFVAYFGTLALWTAVEVAAFLNLYSVRRPAVALWVLLAVFLPFYIIAL